MRPIFVVSAPRADGHNMHIDLSPDCRTTLSTVAAFIRARSVRAWVAGGFIRDVRLGAAAADLDITIDGDPLTLGPPLAESLDAHFVELDAERGHTRLVQRAGGISVDLTPLRAPSIEADLRLRDYTINALAADVDSVLSGEFDPIDPTGGLADVGARILRATSEQCFVDDPLRLLRAPRLAIELDLVIEPDTATLIRRLADSIGLVSPERQREEVMRIFASDRAGVGLRLLDDLGLFAAVFSEMEVTRGVEQPKEHFHDVLGHSFATVGYLDALLADDAPVQLPEKELWTLLWGGLQSFDGVREYLHEPVAGSSRRALLKLCGLLHDIGKPATKTFEEGGRMRFFGHSDTGAELAAHLMRRLCFSRREIAIVRSMIQAHLRPIELGRQRMPSRKAVYKFFRDTGEAGVDTLFLSLADHLGARGPNLGLEGFQAHVALTAYIVQLRFGEQAVVSQPRLIDGDDLMAELGLDPGPLLGRLLEAVREAEAIGEVTTAAEAMAVARAYLQNEQRNAQGASR